MIFDRKSVTCPACSIAVPFVRSVFRMDFQCPHCGAALKVSPLFMRILGLISVLVGYVLAWRIGSFGPQICFGIPLGFYLLWIPIGFLMLMFLVRIIPFLVSPTLVLRKPFESHLTSLDLSHGPRDDTNIENLRIESHYFGQ